MRTIPLTAWVCYCEHGEGGKVSVKRRLVQTVAQGPDGGGAYGGDSGGQHLPRDGRESKRRSAVVDDPALPCEHPKPEPGPRPTRTDPGMLVLLPQVRK